MNEIHYQLDLLKAMNQRLTDREKMYVKICESAVDAFLHYSFEKGTAVTLGPWKDYFDFEVRDARDFEYLFDAVDEAYVLPLREVFYLEKTGGETAKAECRLKGGKRWFQFRAKVYYDQGGRPTDKVVSVSDITRYQTQNEELTYLACYDELTGLYNRNYFVRFLGEYVRNASETGNTVTVMILDVDDFHKINDSLGLVVGDELVQQFAAFLKGLCRDNVIACHLHTDVYCLAIYAPTEEVCADSIYKAIRRRIKEPFQISGGPEIRITVSIGVAEYPEAATTALELINCAEIVVYKSKDLGKNNIQYFNLPARDEFFNATELENKLRKAVANHSFILHYQPQYYAGNRKLRGVEALIRWKDEQSHMISPADFIPVAEKNGSIISIGRWVVEESVRQYAVWRRQFGFSFIVSINISALQYRKEDFVDSILSVLNKYQVSPSEVELEITESILIDDFQSVYEKLKILRDYGIRISLDDFGTGFSSLSYLKKLPIDTLKIDKSFIDTVLTDSATRVITESIVNMVKSLGYDSVAEGVENEKQYQYLHAIGCDVIQGYLFSKPLSAEEMERVLLSGETTER